MKLFLSHKKHFYRQVFCLLCAGLLALPELFEDTFRADIGRVAADRVLNVRVAMASALGEVFSGMDEGARRRALLIKEVREVVRTLKEDHRDVAFYLQGVVEGEEQSSDTGDNGIATKDAALESEGKDAEEVKSVEDREQA